MTSNLPLDPPPRPPAGARRRGAARYLVTLPERAVRAVVGTAAGALHETAQLTLPRVVRRSRLYEATARNALRIAIELVGGVEATSAEPNDPTAGRVAVKKAAGNAIEFGSIAAMGFSPLWLLAAAADVMNGSRVYLRTLERELKQVGVLTEDVSFTSLDQLVGALEGTTGNTARLVDLPPIEVAELKRSLQEFRSDARGLPSPAELATLFNALVDTARRERRPLLEVSSGVGLAILTSAGHVTRDHIVAPYREDWAPLRREGFGAYAARIGAPYQRAVAGHFDPHRLTWTERMPGTVAALARRGWTRVRRGPSPGQRPPEDPGRS